jgi:hypothetical protein
MQMCRPHWQDLKAAIEVRGLSHLIAKDGKAAAEQMMRQASGDASPRDFDPLMTAHTAIASAFIRDVGLTAFEGEKCPLCEVEKSREGLAENWIEGSTDDVLAHAKQVGLVAST